MLNETATTTNLQQIRNLVDQLESHEPKGTDYSNTLSAIKKVIDDLKNFDENNSSFNR